MPTINCALIGAGWIAQVAHLPALTNNPAVKVTAICDTDPARGRAAAVKWRIPQVYEDPSRLIEQEKFDFLVIATPPANHYALAKLGLERGLSVLVEKPLSLSSRDAQELTDLAKAKGCTLGVIHNFLYLPIFQTVLELIARGELGEILDFSARLEYPAELMLNDRDHWRHQLPGGLFTDLAAHPLYLFQQLLGKIEVVAAQTAKRSTIPWVNADQLRVLLKGEKGSGSFTINCSAPGRAFTIYVAGSKIALEFDLFSLSMAKIRPNRGLINQVWHELPLSAQKVGNSLGRKLAGERWYSSGHRIIINDFVTSLINKKATLVGGAEGVSCLAAIEAINRQI